MCGRTLALFLWINLVNLLVLGSASGQVVLPVYLQQSGLTKWEIGFIWGAFAMAAVLMRMKLGGLLVRFGQVPFYFAGALTVACCQLTYSLIHPTAPVVLLLRSLEGAALASYFTAAWARVMDLAPPGALSRTTGLFGISGLVAGAVGPGLLEHIAHRSDYATAFRFSGLLGLLGVALAFVTVRSAERSEPVATPDRAFWPVLLSEPMRSTVIASLIFGGALGIFNTFIAVFIVHLKLHPVGPMFLLYSVASCGVRVRLGHLSDEMHPKNIILPSLWMMSVGMAVVAMLEFFPAYGLFIFAGMLIGAAHGLIFPAISTLASQRAGTSSNTASSVFGACMDFGNLVGCSAAGWVAHHLGYWETFGGLSLLIALAALSIFYCEFNRMTVPGASRNSLSIEGPK